MKLYLIGIISVCLKHTTSLVKSKQKSIKVYFILLFLQSGKTGNFLLKLRNGKCKKALNHCNCQNRDHGSQTLL